MTLRSIYVTSIGSVCNKMKNFCGPNIKGEGHFGAAIWTPPIRRYTTGRRAVSAPDIWAPFPNFFFHRVEQFERRAIP